MNIFNYIEMMFAATLVCVVMIITRAIFHPLVCIIYTRHRCLLIFTSMVS